MEAQPTVVHPHKRNRLRLVRRSTGRAQPASAGPHIEVLRAGARTWNAWRRDNPGVVPELTDLDISVTERQFGRVQGGPINLSRAELRGARLDQATLIEANLMGAILAEADLSDARLERADLRGARLPHASLRGADLSGANLCGADLRLAEGLTQAQLDQAIGDHRTSLPAHLTAPRTWLRPYHGGSEVREPHFADSPTPAYRTGRRPPMRQGREAASPRGSRMVIAVVLAGAIGIGLMTATMHSTIERRSPGDGASAARALVQDGGSPTSPRLPYAPSG
jgi:hypothetical protein